MNNEVTIDLKSGESHTFTFTHATLKKFEQFGGAITRGLDGMFTNMDCYIRAMIVDEGSMSNSKAEKIFEEISDDRGDQLIEFYGELLNTHAEVFSGGEKAPVKKATKTAK